MSNDGFASGFFLGAILMGIVVMVIFGILMHWQNFDAYPSQETVNDICHNLTNNTIAEGKIKDYKLVCTIPSYDHTTNIIIKESGSDDK